MGEQGGVMVQVHVPALPPPMPSAAFPTGAHDACHRQRRVAWQRGRLSAAATYDAVARSRRKLQRQRVDDITEGEVGASAASAGSWGGDGGGDGGGDVAVAVAVAVEGWAGKCRTRCATTTTTTPPPLKQFGSALTAIPPHCGRFSPHTHTPPTPKPFRSALTAI